ncbi:MAG: sugar kinase [Armatimonadetes bacterium]|nr:sugar kinase [Armatimonadota bacterium]
MSFDVFSMCNALYDIQAEVPDEILAELALDKGSMILLSEEQQAAIVPRVYTHIVHTEAGGSGANTAFGVALLGGTACYTSRVGDDEHANLYRSGLGERGVKPNLGTGTGATGVSLILVTPDAQRTMCTYLGRSRELTADDVNLSDLRDSKYLYVTAYLWDTDYQKAAVVRAMEEAIAAGVMVALSLSDPFCVHRHREELLQLIQRHVNLLFGNYSEAEALTGTDSPEEALRVLSQYSDISGRAGLSGEGRRHHRRRRHVRGRAAVRAHPGLLAGGHGPDRLLRRRAGGGEDGTSARSDRPGSPGAVARRRRAVGGLASTVAR